MAIKNKAKKYKDEISQGRRDSLGSGQGEYGSGNIVFKVLRRSGHIEKLNDAYNSTATTYWNKYGSKDDVQQAIDTLNTRLDEM